MTSLLLRNLLFTVLQPGIVAGFIPWLILGRPGGDVFALTVKIHQKTGALIFIAGLILLFACVLGFALRGEGTLSPADPTRKLVTTGPYRFSRNPMYTSIMMILLGESLYTGSVNLLIYSFLIWGAFQLFIVKREEPRLLRDFGKEYEDYRSHTRRWL